MRLHRYVSLRWRLAALLALTVGLFFVVNGLYHVVLKPAEVFWLWSPAYNKSPSATWAIHGSRFRRFATDVITPDLLAALAQVESSGNSLASARWVWRWAWNPFLIYAPPSTATGLFQITDDTFAQARHYCVRFGKLHSVGPWYDLTACWFNGLYNRTLPSHATELTSAYLHVSVVRSLKQLGTAAAAVPLEKKQQLAALMHLCGVKHGDAFVRHGFRLMAQERCGASDPRAYLQRIQSLKTVFRALASGTALVKKSLKR